MWDISKNANNNLFRTKLSNSNFDFCEFIINIDEVADKWTKFVLEIAKECIPNKIGKSNDKPWFRSFFVNCPP
jgi:hypothetical protein